MTEHRVKSWTHLYQAAKSGHKKHDFRDLTERDYKVGDTLILCEYNFELGEFTGMESTYRITYITSNRTPCALSSAVLDNDYCVLSIEKI